MTKEKVPVEMNKNVEEIDCPDHKTEKTVKEDWLDHVINRVIEGLDSDDDRQ